MKDENSINLKQNEENRSYYPDALHQYFRQSTAKRNYPELWQWVPESNPCGS
jgi:hypothetical protein